jgi:hypothetical protein
MLQYGHLDAGSLVSAPFELRATDRAVMVGVASAANAQWYVNAQVAPGAPFLRVVDPWSTFSGAVAAVQEQAHKIDQLKREVASLRHELTAARLQQAKGHRRRS